MAEGSRANRGPCSMLDERSSGSGARPRLTIVRGGTDGSRFTELGLPTPNLSTGEHNPHSPLEWTCLEEMVQAVEMLVELAAVWTEEQAGTESSSRVAVDVLAAVAVPWSFETPKTAILAISTGFDKLRPPHLPS